MLEVASYKLGVAKEELSLSGDGTVRAAAGKSISYGEIAEASGEGIRGHGFYKNFESGPRQRFARRLPKSKSMSKPAK